MLKRLLGKRVHVKPEVVTTPTGMLVFHTGCELLKPHAKLLNHIKRLSSASKHGFDMYYLPVIERFAESLQQLPVASEGQFSRLGGMIEKSLLLIIESLRVRQGYLLPVGSKAEEIAKKKELWTYAVFVGALVHRCGQGYYEFEMVLFNKEEKGLNERYWPGFSQVKPDFCFYKIRQLNNETKKLERYFPLMMLRTWLGDEGTNWLLSDDLAMEALLSLMVGGELDDKNTLSEIIRKGYAHLTKGSNNNYPLEDSVEPAPPEEAHMEVSCADDNPGPLQESEVDWINETPERFIAKLVSDIRSNNLPLENFKEENGLVKVRYPLGLKKYTKSPSEMRMHLRGSVLCLAEEKIDFNNEKNVKVIVFKVLK